MQNSEMPNPRILFQCEKFTVGQPLVYKPPHIDKPYYSDTLIIYNRAEDTVITSGFRKNLNDLKVFCSKELDFMARKLETVWYREDPDATNQYISENKLYKEAYEWVLSLRE